MPQPPPAKEGLCGTCFSRAVLCKITIALFIIFVFLQYSFNILMYSQPMNKFVSPGLTWISNLNHKWSDKDDTFQNVEVDLRRNSSNANIYSSNESAVSSQLSVLLNSTTSQQRDCPLVPPKLVGKIKVLTESPPFSELNVMWPNLNPGGRFRPKECKSRWKVALIIPYRDREEHLRIFLHNIHPVLQRQQLDYGVYVIEETADAKFNRAMLMNIGYMEALKQYDYDCFIFHDVDLIPEDDRNLYNCPEQPRHMSVAINTMNYRLPYKDIFGGVSALTKQHMLTVNGFSNEFWGWGGEDDDMSNRIRYHGLKISRYPPKIARYTMLKHKKDDPNPDRYNKLYRGKFRYTKDGLSNLRYTRVEIAFKPLYTWVLVEIEPIK